MSRRSLGLLVALGLVAVLSCKYDPRPPNGTQKCAGADAGKQCPTGYECRAGRCYNTPADGGGSKLHALRAADGGGTSGDGDAGGDTMAPPARSDASVAETGDAMTPTQARPAAD